MVPAAMTPGQGRVTRQGLYDPANEHDACGVGMVADLAGRKSHDIVVKALTVLRNLDHRGAKGAEPDDGDGAGILTQIPDELFREAVRSVGLSVPSSRIVTSLDDLEGVALPAVVRPAFTLGGHGGGFAETDGELRAQIERGLRESPIGQVLVEESVRGWDEFELEVVREMARCLRVIDEGGWPT